MTKIWQGDVSWEEVESHFSLLRAKVPGGWLLILNWGSGTGLTFYPDPNHKWDGKSLP